MKLARVVIKVRDYRRSFEFYKNLLGLKLSTSWQRKDSWGAVFIAGNGMLEIIWYPSDKGLEECNYMIEKDKIEIYLEVNDIDILHRRLAAGGAEVIDSPHDVPWGYRIFKIKDPDNIPLILAQPIT